MDFVLKKIKRLIIKGNFKFTLKADAERLVDGLTQEDVLESILNASLVRTKKSRSPWRKESDERIYIIESFTYDGILIYSKGVIRKEELTETFYIIVSSKRSTLGG
ncbi:hypothetical protein L0337_10965 [candidate division KSB1 bacterium]|nr:hypothetical protein [candidate division KSB1 bacterium]